LDAEDAWIRYCKSKYSSDIVSAAIEKFAEDFTIQTKYDQIAIGQIDLAG